MKQYHDLVKHVLENGNEKSDRTGTGTKSVFGHQMRFDLSKGFPMVTTKKLHLKSIVYELLWFINHNNSYTIDFKCNFFVVTIGKPLLKSNLIWCPKTLLVPVPVLSDFSFPFSKTCFTKSWYCFIIDSFLGISKINKASIFLN